MLSNLKNTMSYFAQNYSGLPDQSLGLEGYYFF